MLPKNPFLICFLCLILGCSLCWAQSGKDVRNPQEKAHERIQMIKMWKLTETLKLDREETAKFFAISNQYEEAKKKLHRELHEDLQKLRNILRETHPQEKELREVISRIKTKKRDLQDIRVKQNEEEINFLKTEQQARYILFQIDFRRDMESMIREIREERPRRPGYDGPAEKNR